MKPDGTSQRSDGALPEDRGEGSAVRKFSESLAQLAPAQIVADPAVEPGGCRVITGFGEIDQRIESQLERIVEELTG